MSILGASLALQLICAIQVVRTGRCRRLRQPARRPCRAARSIARRL